jgi:hypothetical protein
MLLWPDPTRPHPPLPSFLQCAFPASFYPLLINYTSLRFCAIINFWHVATLYSLLIVRHSLPPFLPPSPPYLRATPWTPTLGGSAWVWYLCRLRKPHAHSSCPWHRSPTRYDVMWHRTATERGRREGQGRGVRVRDSSIHRSVVKARYVWNRIFVEWVLPDCVWCTAQSHMLHWGAQRTSHTALKASTGCHARWISTERCNASSQMRDVAL